MGAACATPRRLCGPILELMSRAEAAPFERAKAWLARWTERHFGADRTLAKGVAAAAAVLLLLLTVAPGSYRISRGPAWKDGCSGRWSPP